MTHINRLLMGGSILCIFLIVVAFFSFLPIAFFVAVILFVAYMVGMAVEAVATEPDDLDW